MKFATIVFLLCLSCLTFAQRQRPSKSSLRRDIKRFVDKFPKLKELLNSQTSQTDTIVKRITNRGFLTFSQSASMQALDNIEPSMYAGFTEAVIGMMNVPSNKIAQVKAVFEMVPFMKHNEWHAFRFVFDINKGGVSKYVCILAHNDGKAYDFVLADMQTTFSLAPNLLVVTEKKSGMFGMFGSSRTVVKKIPASITASDMEVLMNFFDMAAFTRFAKMLNINISVLGTMTNQPSTDPATIIAGITAGIELWDKIRGSLSTKIENKLVKEIAGQGFDKFTMHSVGHIVEGLQPSALDRYISMFSRLYNVPDKYAKSLEDILFLVKWSKSQTWQKNDVMFDINKGGTNRWMTFLYNKQKDGTYNFLICTVKQTFNLAPNVLLIEQSKSILGGIYGQTKIKTRRVPRSLTDKDLEQLIAFFNIITFKRFAAVANIQIKKPDPIIRT